jgi:ribonuclease P protein component
VRRLGKSYAHPLAVLIVQANEEHRLRIGVLATRSVGGAVERNRGRRLLRAAIQPWIARIPPGWDILLIARQPLLSATFSQIQTALETLIARARLLREVYVD